MKRLGESLLAWVEALEDGPEFRLLCRQRGSEWDCGKDQHFESQLIQEYLLKSDALTK